jgi:hypothetical protein
MDNSDRFLKNCPSCGKEISYRRKEDLTYSIKNNSRCRSCANSGANHPSFGKKLSEERRAEISARTSGEKNPNYGKIMPPHVKEAMRRANIGRKPINIEARKGKTLEEIYGVDRAKDIREKYKNRPPPSIESNIKRSESCKKSGCGQAATGRVASDEERRRMRLRFIAKLEETGKTFHPPFNRKACAFFDKLMTESETPIHIRHALNGGEFHVKELGFWLDGYDEVNNVAYEYDELKHHYKNGELSEKDKIRQKLIEEHLNCKFIRIKETG